MKTRWLIGIVFLTAANLIQTLPASAHRLDEYLQATRIAVEPERVNVEIDLTPGADVAANVIALIDANHDGEISKAEQEAYARLVLASATLEVDDASRRLMLTSSVFPSILEMKEGVGVIRVKASAATPGAGRHRLFFRNGHRPDISVYLANALVPASDIVTIAQQDRDTLQHELRFDYSISPRTSSVWLMLSWWLIPVFGVAAIVVRFRLSHGRS
jgi:hypothetical protein